MNFLAFAALGFGKLGSIIRFFCIVCIVSWIRAMLCRMEIRLQFHHVPGNIYRERIGHNMDRANNELILRDVPDEAILIKVNNKVPGLEMLLDTSELNLLYKDK